MESGVLYNPIIEDMKIKNALQNRTVDFVEDFEENSCYKAIYLLDKIVKNDKLKNKKPSDITIRINSYGGYCYELWSLIDVIEGYKKEGYTFTTRSIGKSMSCGFILFLSGDTRIASKYSTLLHHSVASGMSGKVQDLREELKHTERLNEMGRNYVLKQTNIPIEKLDEIDKNKEDYIFSLEELKEYNIATEII